MLAEAACFYQVNVLVYRDFFVQWRLLCEKTSERACGSVNRTKPPIEW